MLKLTLEPRATAVTDPPHVLVTSGAAATTRPAGNVSVKLASTATTLGLFRSNSRVVGVLAGIVAGLKSLVIWSGSRMMMPTVAVPPLDAPSPAVVV